MNQMIAASLVRYQHYRWLQHLLWGTSTTDDCSISCEVPALQMIAASLVRYQYYTDASHVWLFWIRWRLSSYVRDPLSLEPSTLCIHLGSNQTSWNHVNGVNAMKSINIMIPLSPWMALSLYILSSPSIYYHHPLYITLYYILTLYGIFFLLFVQ